MHVCVHCIFLRTIYIFRSIFSVASGRTNLTSQLGERHDGVAIGSPFYIPDTQNLPVFLINIFIKDFDFFKFICKNAVYYYSVLFIIIKVVRNCHYQRYILSIEIMYRYNFLNFEFLLIWNEFHDI